MNIAIASQAPSRVRHAVKKPSKAPTAPVAPHAKKENKNLLGPVLVGGGALAVGGGMLFPDTVSAVFDCVATTLTPSFQTVAPILHGAALGMVSGAVTGGAYGRLATINHHDSTPLFATFGGVLAGASLGAMTGGICAGFGANPLLAVPVAVAAGAAFSLYDRVNS